MSSSSFYPQSQQLPTAQQQQFQTILKSILPQIQKELLKDIELQLQNEFQQKYLAKLQEINKQAEKQYEFAIKQLDQSSKLLQQEKSEQINKELMNLQQIYDMIQQQRLIKIQQKFLQQNFQQRIMSHPKILDLEKDIEQQIYSLLQQKHELTKQRQLKELIIGNQTKQIKIRKQLDQQIKSKIYNSSGLQELKQEINQSKIQMGSQKSEYNLKLKKVQQEIKQYQDKIKAIEKMGNLQEMRIRHNQLRIQLVEKQEQQVFKNQIQQQESSNQTKRISKLQKQHEQMENQIKGKKNNNMRQNNKSIQKRNNDDSLQKSQQDQFYSDKRYGANNNKNKLNQKEQTQQKTLKRQPKNQSFSLTGRGDPNTNQHYQQHQQDPSEQQSQSHYNNHDINIKQQNYSSQQNQQNTKKFDLTSYFKKYLISSQTAKITESQNVVISQNEETNRMNSKDSCSLLNLENISQMLKQKLKIDPLQRYLNKQSIAKQNNLNSQNIRIPTGQKSSNFAELYEQHLKNLNKGMAKKYQKGKAPSSDNGLSQMAKKSIIKNLSKYHKQTFGSTKSNMDQHPVHQSKSTYSENRNLINSNMSKQPSNNNMIKSFTFAKYINSSRGTMQEYPPQQSNLLASFK